MQPDHPTDDLIATVEGVQPDSVASSMQALSRHLAGRRRWVLGPPEFVDEPGFGDGRSLGFALSIYTARPPWDERMDPAIDRAQLEEVKELLSGVCRISGEHDVAFDVYFAGELVGGIEEGLLDTSLAVGLVGEWERVLAEREPSLTG